MQARIRKTMEEREEGFTLIELLVVIIIIGILAAIAIPVFLNQRKKGYDAQAKSDVKNAATAMETALSDSPTQAYPASTTTEALTETALANYNWKKSVNTTQVVITTTGTAPNQSYKLAGTSGSGNLFCYDSANSDKGVYAATGSPAAC